MKKAGQGVATLPSALNTWLTALVFIFKGD